MITAQFPDGVEIHFPDGTPPEEVDRIAAAFMRARSASTPLMEQLILEFRAAADRIVAAQMTERVLVRDGQQVKSVPVA